MTFNVHRPIVKCEFCSLELSVQNLSRHLKACKLHPSNIKERSETIFKCEYCDSFYTLEQSRSKRFCSKKCTSLFSRRSVLDEDTKSTFCVQCNTPILIKIRASEKFCKCEECKLKKELDINPDFACPICFKTFKTKAGVISHKKVCVALLKGEKVSLNYKRADIREGYIYLIKNKLNDKVYIGKKKGKPDDSKLYYGSGLAIKNAINKYGKDNFEKIILEYLENGDLNERERYWIRQYESFSDSGYNLTHGGDGGGLFLGKKHSDLTKQKLRILALKK